MSDQLQFDWAGPAKESVDRQPKRHATPVPQAARVPKTSQSLPSPSPHRKINQKTLCYAVEEYLKARNIPYVDVHAAKRELFGSCKLGTFHLVAYNKKLPEGKNWLIWAAAVRPETKKDMTDWQSIFGEDFMAVFAGKSKTGELSFKTLDNQPVAVE